MMIYHSFRWWIRWFVPLPILIRVSKRTFGNHHVWYQDDSISLETHPFDRAEITDADRQAMADLDRYI
jgi:hypothetical protein